MSNQLNVVVTTLRELNLVTALLTEIPPLAWEWSRVDSEVFGFCLGGAQASLSCQLYFTITKAST